MNLPELICKVVGHDISKPWETCGRCGWQKDRTVIPIGYYCYTYKSYRKKEGFYLCPYWSTREDKPNHENGYCSYLEYGDWEGLSMLWDECKECGINIGNEEDWKDTPSEIVDNGP